MQPMTEGGLRDVADTRLGEIKALLQGMPAMCGFFVFFGLEAMKRKFRLGREAMMVKTGTQHIQAVRTLDPVWARVREEAEADRKSVV